MKYEVEVIEVRHVSMLYAVEADTEEEAVRLASRGITVSEDESNFGNFEIQHREVQNHTLKRLEHEKM